MKSHFLLLMIICIPLLAISQVPITKIFIVRHADRLGNADDLSAAGVSRANELRRVLGKVKIDSIYSTDFVRTRKTALPLATLKGLPTTIYSNATVLITHIVTHVSGKRTLVVGHSDTVDDLITSCGCTPPATITPNMPATQFDHLFEVLVQKIPGQAALKCELIQMKYGAVTN
jgi:broad specificity phosphatase PhoE